MPLVSRAMRRLCLTLPLFLVLALLAACDSGGGSYPTAGTTTITPDQGINFHTGQLQDPGNFKNSDLFATQNGSALKLATGGDTPTVNNPANWFRSGGGVHETFASLVDVPETTPTDDMTDSLVKAKVGNGFVIRTHGGLYVRGWIEAASDASVTIQWQRVETTGS